MCYLPTFVFSSHRLGHEESNCWQAKRDHPLTYEKLECEDFAGDIALLSHNLKDIEEETARVETAAAHVGLHMLVLRLVTPNPR